MRLDWSRLAQAERVSAYGNSRAVENSATLIEQRNAASAAHLPGALVPLPGASHFTILQQLQSAPRALSNWFESRKAL